jgi:integrase
MKRKIQTVEMSERNRELILAFDRMCFLKEALSKPRLIRIMQALSIIARRYAFGDFDQLDKKAVEEMVLRIETNDDYSIWTKQSYKSIIKKFYKWLVQGDAYSNMHHYPDLVSWINTNVKKKDKPKVKASDLLTEPEIKRLMSVADHPRDKAFISMIYELGARIGEIGGLRIQDVTKDQYSYIVDLSGKTGHRTPRIVIADPDITAWLNIHPMAEKPYAPLWLPLGDSDGKFMEYGAFRQVIQRLKKRAGVKKRLYHHLFRHTRVTHLLMNKEINEAQAKVYFGWVPESKMLSEYAHLMSSDVNNAILRIHGIKTHNTDQPMLTPKQCRRCQTINSVNARFCYKCSAILDMGTAIGLDEEHRRGNEVLAELMKDSEVRHFLAKKIHDLGLRDKLLKGDS